MQTMDNCNLNSFFSLGRFNRRLLRTLVQFILLLVLSIPASAKNFSVTLYNGSRFTEEGIKYVTIKNLTQGPIVVGIDIVGSSDFVLYGVNPGLTTIRPDSGNGSRSIGVWFRPSSPSEVSADVIISNGGVVDTVHFTGVDTSGTIPSFRILNGRPYTFQPAGRDSVKLMVLVENRVNRTLTLTAALSGVTSGCRYELRSNATRVIAPFALDSVHVVYFNDTYSDAGEADFSISDADHNETILLRALPKPRQGLSIGSPYVGGADPGQKICDQFMIYTPDAGTTSITSITINSDRFSIENVSLPKMLTRAGDYMMYDLCYTPPTTAAYGSSEFAEMTVSYTDILGSHQIKTQIYGSVKDCMEILPDTLRFEPTLVGGWVEAQAFIVNHSASSLELQNFTHSFDTLVTFSLSSGDDMVTVPPGDTVAVTLRFTPHRVGKERYGYVVFNLDSASECHTAYLALIGSATEVEGDSTDLDLFPNQKESLLMSGERDPVTRSFEFWNNTAGNLKVVDIALASGAHFHIQSIAPSSPPLTLGPGESVTVVLEFDADTNGFYRDSLLVITENGLKTLVFPVQGVQGSLATSAVKTIWTTPARLTIYPNPARGPIVVAVEGANSVNVKILDVLGKQVFEGKGVDQIRWDAQAPDLSAGSYIVRVSGVDAEGREFIESRTIALER